MVARKKPVQLTVEDLKAIEPDEPREITALEHHAQQLADETIRLRAEGEAKQADIDHLNEAIGRIEASLSWRITSPLRRAKSGLPED